MIYSLTDWEKIVAEAYASNCTLREWCRRNQINFNTFCSAKRKLLAKGKLSFLEEKVFLPPCSQDSPYAEFPMTNGQAFLVLKPIRSNLSIESMVSIIWFDLNLALLPGSVFFFISKNKKQIYALKICENGYCLFSRKLDSGTFSWPDCGDKEAFYLYRWEYDKIAKTLEM